MTTLLERLTKKKDKLLKEIEKAKAKELQKDKKYLDKKRQLVGEYFLNHYKNKMDELKVQLDPFLKSIKNRKLFDLEIKQKKDSQSETKTDSTNPESKNPYWKKKW